MNDPLRNPRDPAWQLVGVTISATALIISLFSLPNSTKLTAIIVGFMGLIACIYIIFLSRRVVSASHQGNNPVRPVSDLLHSRQAQLITPTDAPVPGIHRLPESNEGNKSAQQVVDPSHREQAQVELPASAPAQNTRSTFKRPVWMTILRSLAITVIVTFIVAFALIFDVFNPTTLLSIVLAFALLGLVIVFIVSCRIVFQLTYRHEISIKPIILFSIAVFILAIGVLVTVTSLTNGFTTDNILAALWFFTFLIAAENLIILIGTLVSALIRRIKASSKQ